MTVDLDKNKTKILEMYNDVLDDKTSTDWALFGYEGQTNVLKVVQSGDYGVEEMFEDLNASKIMYGVVRVADPKTSRTKIVLINWQGEGAPNLRKGVCARHLTDVKRMLKGVHITVNARTEEDIDASIIMDAVAKATSTEYNFSERSELPEKNVPVKNIVNQFHRGEASVAMGTNYKRTNPQSEINSNHRNKFWEEQEAEEKVRKEVEIQKRNEEAKRLERERVEREINDCKHREEINKERNARIVAEKKAETVAYVRTSKVEDKKEWEKELGNQQTEEVERARRADHMRMERKKEAENLIGHRTHLTRSLFETKTTPSSYVDARSKPPPKVLKDFNPSKADSASPDKESSAEVRSVNVQRSVGARWPPPSSEEEAPKQASPSVHGKITNWKPLDIHETEVHASQERVTAEEVKQLTKEHRSHFDSNISSTEERNSKVVKKYSSSEETRTQTFKSDSSVLENNTRTATKDSSTDHTTNRTVKTESKKTRGSSPVKDDWSPQRIMPSPADRPLSPRQENLLTQNQSVNAMSNKQSSSPISQVYVPERLSSLDKPPSSTSNQSFLHSSVKQHSFPVNQPSSPLSQPSSPLKQPSSPLNQASSPLNQPSSSPGKVSSPRKEFTSPPMETDLDSVVSSGMPLTNEVPASVTPNGHATSYKDDSEQPYSNGGLHPQAISPTHYEGQVNQEDLESFSMMYEVDGIEYQILPEHGLCARALYDYQAADETEITFDPGDIITNIEQIDVGWWQGVSSMGVFGLFPANYVELINGTKAQ